MGLPAIIAGVACNSRSGTAALAEALAAHRTVVHHKPPSAPSPSLSATCPGHEAC